MTLLAIIINIFQQIFSIIIIYHHTLYLRYFIISQQMIRLRHFQSVSLKFNSNAIEVVFISTILKNFFFSPITFFCNYFFFSNIISYVIMNKSFLIIIKIVWWWFFKSFIGILLESREKSIWEKIIVKVKPKF